MLQNIVFIEMSSLISVLFWGNTISLVFLLIYYSKSQNASEKLIVFLLLISRLCNALHYFVIFGRGILPNLISVNLGSIVLFIGCYFEAQAILRIIKENTKFTTSLMYGILLASILLANIAEFIAPFGGIRITMSSLGVVALMALPVTRMLLAKNSNIYIKPIAILFVLYLSLLLARAWYGSQNLDTSILATNILQSVTFLALLLQIIIALPSYILIIKGYADDAILLMATTDKLTGAQNRHAFMNAATAIYKNCKRFQLHMSVLFMDIDHFKMVNDKYGHPFGDLVLARTATLIEKCIRESDLICRYGGEEFVMLLPRSDCVVARQVAERIMEEVAQTRFDEHPEFTFTVSIGIFSEIPQEGQDFADIITHSDKAMYQAKQLGRNRIVFCE